MKIHLSLAVVRIRGCSNHVPCHTTCLLTTLSLLTHAVRGSFPLSGIWFLLQQGSEAFWIYCIWGCYYQGFFFFFVRSLLPSYCIWGVPFQSFAVWWHQSSPLRTKRKVISDDEFHSWQDSLQYRSLPPFHCGQILCPVAATGIFVELRNW